jgi:hypothetical protein
MTEYDAAYRQSVLEERERRRRGLAAEPVTPPPVAEEPETVAAKAGALPRTRVLFPVTRDNGASG